MHALEPATAAKVRGQARDVETWHMRCRFGCLALVMLLAASCSPAADVTVPTSPTSQPQNGWSRIDIEGVGSLDFPVDFLELEAGAYATIAEEYRAVYSLSQPEFVLQQPGLSALEPSAFEEYRRLLFHVDEVRFGQVEPQSTKPWTLTADEKAELEAFAAAEYSALLHSQSGTELEKIRLVSPHRIEVSQLAGLFPMLMSYQRQYENNPVVEVQDYIFGINRKQIHVTVSYRLEDKATTEPRFREVLDTLRLYS